MTAGTGVYYAGDVRNPYAAMAETRLPARPGRVFAGAAGIVGGIFLTTWTYLNLKERRETNSHQGKSLAGWKHRMSLAASPNAYLGADASTSIRYDVDERQTNASLKPPAENNREQHLLTGLRVGDIKRDPTGGPMHPTPQRHHAHEEGLAYTKKVNKTMH